MLETKEERQKREREEAAIREERIRAYEKKMNVELPYSPVAVIERKPVEPSVTLQPEVKLRNKPKSRAKYMQEYRKKPKLCPHCGKDIALRAQP